MIESLNSISAAGWGQLLKSLVPMSWGLIVIDLLFFVVFPLLVLLGLVLFFRKHVKTDEKGAWRACGAAWSKAFWISMILMIFAYFGVKDVLRTSLSGVDSFEKTYQASLPGYNPTARATENEMAIAAEIRNQKVAIQARDPQQRAEFKIVRFFFRNYALIHPFFFTLIDMIILGWFFWPGFKMKKQGINL